jgi:uncharacterized membrane protein
MKVASVRRGWSPLLGILLLASPSVGAAQEAVVPASAGPVEVNQVGSDWSQAQVIVNAPPGVVWDTVQQVPEWPRVLSDVEQMRVIEHDGPAWVVDLESRTLHHGMHRYSVRLDPMQRRVIARSRGGGVSVDSYMLVRPGPTPSQSDVVYSLRIETSGVARLAMSEGTLHTKQAHIVESTLEDLQRRFAR